MSLNHFSSRRHDALCLRHTPRILRSLRHESTVNHVSFYILSLLLWFGKYTSQLNKLFYCILVIFAFCIFVFLFWQSTFQPSSCFLHKLPSLKMFTSLPLCLQRELYKYKIRDKKITILSSQVPNSLGCSAQYTLGAVHILHTFTYVNRGF